MSWFKSWHLTWVAPLLEVGKIFEIIMISFSFRFGVCCTFIYTAASTLSENNSYIQNPNYPSAYGSTSSLSFTVSKCSNGLYHINCCTWITPSKMKKKVFFQKKSIIPSPHILVVLVITSQGLLGTKSSWVQNFCFFQMSVLSD